MSQEQHRKSVIRRYKSGYQHGVKSAWDKSLKSDPDTDENDKVYDDGFSQGYKDAGKALKGVEEKLK